MKTPTYEFASWAVGPLPVLVAGVALVLSILIMCIVKLLKLRGRTTSNVRIWLKILGFSMIFIGLLLYLEKISTEGTPPMYGYNLVLLLGLAAVSLSVIYDPAGGLVRWVPFLSNDKKQQDKTPSTSEERGDL